MSFTEEQEKIFLYCVNNTERLKQNVADLVSKRNTLLREQPEDLHEDILYQFKKACHGRLSVVIAQNLSVTSEEIFVFLEETFNLEVLLNG